MKNNFLRSILVLSLVGMTAGCTNDELDKELLEETNFSGRNEKVSNADASGLAGPVFDLEVTPNGEILVADFSKGITDLQGNVLISLEQVTSVSAVGKGSMWATTGPEEEGIHHDEQKIYRVHNDRVELVTDLFVFESNNNPDGTTVDSNPFSIKALNSHSALVSDSGANTLLRVDNRGNVEVLAIFPPQPVSPANAQELFGCPGSGHEICRLNDEIPAQAVPTSIAIGPDGYYYVGELTGFPAPVGESRIWKVSPDAVAAQCGSDSNCVSLFDGGFTSIIDLAFGPDGLLYVAEMDVRSWLGAETGGRIQVCDPETLNCEEVAVNIPLLTSIVFDKEGKLWATRNALVPGQVEVVQIEL